MSVIERRNSFGQQPEVIIMPPNPQPLDDVDKLRQVETCLNPPQRPPRSPSPHKMRRLSDAMKSVTPQPPKSPTAIVTQAELSWAPAVSPSTASNSGNIKYPKKLIIWESPMQCASGS